MNIFHIYCKNYNVFWKNEKRLGWAIFKNFLQNELTFFRSVEDRLAAARVLDGLDDLPGPLLADSIDDSTSRSYGSFPDRLYILHEGKVAYQGGLGPHGYIVSIVIVLVLTVILNIHLLLVCKVNWSAEKRSELSEKCPSKMCLSKNIGHQLQHHSNPDCQNIRWGRWPLDHHHNGH